jgi:hypothetical protein
MKKILIAFLIIPSVCFAKVDYSQIPKEKYNKYQYAPSSINPSQNSTKQQLDNYNYNYSVNPKIISGKYQHLYNNRATENRCWEKAAATYNLDPWLLLSYAKVESSFKSQAINRNSDKLRSIDVGMMQINSFWFPVIQKFGITPKDLLDPCLSLFVASWIITQNIKRFGYNIDGIGAYNSPNNLYLRRTYGLKVYKAYDEITRDLYYGK